jgi:hypothetical protein
MNFDRRKFLGATCAVAIAPQTARAADTAVSVTLQPDKTLGVIPSDFMGLGYEITTLATPQILSARNATYVRLVKNLGREGVIRIGGNTSDFSTYGADATPVALAKSGVIDKEGLTQLREFLDAVNWKLIWGLNLGSDDIGQAVEEARAVVAIMGRRLIALQIGNEPDLFVRTGHRTGDWTYARWHDDYLRFKAAVRKTLPRVAFAGPDLAGASDWLGLYAKDEGQDAVLLTAHHYISGQAAPTAGIDAMLAQNSRYQPVIEGYTEVAKKARLPWRMCETNSFSGGGKSGASDSFAGALWALDYMFVLASVGCAGVNMEAGVNQLDFISHYSPIADDTHGNFSAAPEYYGMLAFAQAGRGNQIGVVADVGGINLTAYATQPRAGRTILTLVNKDKSQNAAVTVTGLANLSTGRILRLQAPAIDATANVTLGGASVSADGNWKPANTETVEGNGMVANLNVPACSAALVTFG